MSTVTPCAMAAFNEKVARALGWKKPSEIGCCDVCGWPLDPKEEMCRPGSCAMRPPIPDGQRADEPGDYATSWAVTGPLIERLGIDDLWEKRSGLPGRWAATTSHPGAQIGYGPTPLIAICNLILLLAEDGLLPKGGAS